MKKIILLAVVFAAFFGLNKISAQTTSSTTLNVVLSSVQAIEVKESSVAINFTTSAHYSSGVSAAQANHITFASTDKFNISVSAPDLKGGVGGDIPISTISLKPTLASSVTTLTAPTANDIAALSSTPQTLFSSTSGTTEGKLDVTYKASGGSQYLGKTGAYTSVITYSIAPN